MLIPREPFDKLRAMATSEIEWDTVTTDPKGEIALLKSEITRQLL
jgi:hypothetical protein